MDDKDTTMLGLACIALENQALTMCAVAAVLAGMSAQMPDRQREATKPLLDMLVARQEEVETTASRLRAVMEHGE